MTLGSRDIATRIFCDEEDRGGGEGGGGGQRNCVFQQLGWSSFVKTKESLGYDDDAPLQIPRHLTLVFDFHAAALNYYNFINASQGNSMS